MLWTLIKMAWRNLWRNRRRTLITAGAVGLGLAAIVQGYAFNQGMLSHMMDTMTLSGMGDAQIHATEYRNTGDEKLIISDSAKILDRARNHTGIRQATPRAYSIGLVAMGDRAKNVTIMGVDLATEPGVTNFQDRLVKGEYLHKPNHVLIGRDLAGDMEVEVGSKLVVTSANIMTGDMNSMLVYVAGVIFTNNQAMDKNTIIMPLVTAQDIFGIPGQFHEIAMAVDVGYQQAELMIPILNGLRGDGIEVAGWWQLNPLLNELVDLQNLFLAILLAIIFFLVSFGIVNTLSMSLLERFREFGIMRAIGTTPTRLGGLLFIEALSLGVVGAVIGLVMAGIINAIVSYYGINMGNVVFEGVTMETELRPIMDWGVAFVLAIIFIILTPLVALGPAIRAGRVDVVRALRHE